MKATTFVGLVLAVLGSVAMAGEVIDPAPSGNEQAQIHTGGTTDGRPDEGTVTIPGNDSPVTGSREGKTEHIDFGSDAPDAHPDDTTIVHDTDGDDEGE